MQNEPTGRLDPERLKHERTEVDLGTDQETEHNLVDREAGRPPQGASDDPTAHPTAGVTPPAR
jgi:hypothetical protein